ncbi:MAG TPA: PQQ-dependent sugar dehydrogenase [Methanomicrobiales archaeon]|nr:PQQ-dependent sugar dehydrogenase [Methanomicrobiales archaeon]
MKNKRLFFTLIIAIAVLAALAGCAAQQAPSPAISIVTPQNGATVQAGDIPVTVQVSNFNIVDKQGQASVAGEGHVHFYLDIGTVPSDPAKPAIPSDASVPWAHVSGTSYTFANVAPGTHVITVQLVNNDHTPLIPLAVATATITVGPAATATTGVPAADLTNQNSPEAATFTTYPSRTKLHTPDVPIGLKFVAGGFTSPMLVVPAPDSSGRLFLVDQTGVVKIFFMNGTVLDQPFLDLRSELVQLDPTYDERGLFSIAFHPQYNTNGRVFAYYSAPLRAGVDPNWSCTNHLSEFHVSPDPNRVDMSSEKILLTVDKPYENHNGGTLNFGPSDGYLYLPLGDGGRADDTGMGHTPVIGNAQDLTKILGKVIRIDVDHSSAGKSYAIPPDNPFLSNPNALPEIYAYGFRNPAYSTFDSGGSHRMFISMAGQRLFESVFAIYQGGDYPWNIREGTHCFNPANDFTPPAGPCPTTGATGQPLIGPIVELGHDVGDVIVGGVLYRGTLVPSLQGKFVFGTWSDENRILGNGSLLVATPPAGLDLSSLPSLASALTPAQNAMWATQNMRVMNNPNGRINAFILQLSQDNNHEILVLMNQNGGPGLSPQGSGEVWQVVPGTTPNLEVTTAHLPTTPVPTTQVPTGGAVTLQLAQQGDKFVPATLSVPAGSTITLVLNDQDRDPHNFALYSSTTSSSAIFRSPVVTGPVTLTYIFPAPTTPGTYYYRSDPNVGMVGTLTVTAASSGGGSMG